METPIKVQNLKCGGCANTIQQKLISLQGVENVTIDVENKLVHITHQDSVSFEILANKLKAIGYPMEGEENSLGAKATSMVSCAIGKISS